MKKLSKALLVAMMTVAAVSCKEDNPDPIPVVVDNGPRDPQGRVVLEGEIKTSRTLLATEKYLLKGFVYVTEGVTLEIQPGTVIFGDKDTKGSLIIERGAKLIANGTAAKPIVFTSAQAKGSRKYGDWGGVVLVGRAPMNQPSSTKLEGGIRGEFGGSDAADNSGSLQYVRIEFAGVPLSAAANSEINGLTMYGVGAGTKLDYIQISYSGDDSYEWFGGNVNAKHLVAYRGWDDDFDTDFGYTGKVQYAVSLRDPQIADQSGSNAFESDNFNPGTKPDGTIGANEGMPLTAPVFSNVSAFVTAGTPSNAQQSGSGAYQSGMHLRRNTSTSIFNTVVVGYPEGLRFDGGPTWANAQSGGITLSGVVLANTATALVPKNNTDAFTLDQLTTWFKETQKGNTTVLGAELSTLGLNPATFNLLAPNFLPEASSPLLTGAAFEGKAADSFFDKVTYKGAFGTENWVQGWTNFTPESTDY
ncbi:hypothetical protein [Hymenobacter sp. DG25A]|uniref:hypothetical protein n=1 Tax=Hymenobacter sp. DG25A TaxID=1385663 RepID=UPI0006BC615D|nr:hypothetical protein [Hymenobacter sp. DG25A]ALD19940.1 hypothetical protein AM218_00190 [Hymenobacter sp. DG25A]